MVLDALVLPVGSQMNVNCPLKVTVVAMAAKTLLKSQVQLHPLLMFSHLTVLVELPETCQGLFDILQLTVYCLPTLNCLGGS